MKNIICIWAGAVVDIPAGWALCDGNGGRPDLRGKFVVGAGDALDPDQTAATNIVTDAGVPYYALCFIMKL